MRRLQGRSKGTGALEWAWVPVGTTRTETTWKPQRWESLSPRARRCRICLAEHLHSAWPPGPRNDQAQWVSGAHGPVEAMPVN